MSRKSVALAVAFAALLAACAGRYGSNTASNGSTFALPNMPDLTITATYPKGMAGSGTIMEELPAEGLGTIMDPFWSARSGVTRNSSSRKRWASRPARSSPSRTSRRASTTRSTS